MIYNYVHPYLLPDGEEEAADEILGVYDSALSGDGVYVEGDLVTISPTTGKVMKWIAPGAGLLLGLANQKYDQPFAKQYFLDFGVPINILDQENYFVFTYQAASLGAVADGSDALFDASDLAAVQGGATRDLQFNATEKAITIADSVGTANTPQVKMIRAYKGGVGDSNVQVLARIQLAWLLGA